MMADSFDYDVFISYSSCDKDWVRGALLTRLEQTGLRAFIDFRDFTPGAPSIKECERGVLKCPKTLVVLTPNYLNSGWTEIENVMAQTLDPANMGPRMIPLLKVECEKPLRIAALTHIDFTDNAESELAWRRLLTALGRPPEPEQPKEAEHGEWHLVHPYPMPANFTGRLDERAMLTRWVESDTAHPLLIVRALGGFGKSALVWHWLINDVNQEKWARVVWWSFYERDAQFGQFLADLLKYLNIDKLNAKELSAKDSVREFVRKLASPGTLLVLDGFERELRAFGGLGAAYQGDDVQVHGKSDNSEGNDRDCISLITELFLYNVALQPGLRSKVLLTTRLRPRALEAKGGGLLHGCLEQELRQMQPDDAVGFFSAQGIRGTHTEIKTACERYGYHPLSLRLLPGMIVEDFQQPGDIAAASRLDVSGDLVQRQHHVLETAYNSLKEGPRTLLGRIACFRGPMNYNVLAAIATEEDSTDSQPAISKKASPAQPLSASAVGLNSDLRELLSRGLLLHDTRETRFDLHPIVRCYAYDRLAAPDRASAHTRLRDYFAAVPLPDRVTRLEDLTAVIELYHHTVRCGQFDNAFRLYLDHLHHPLYFQLGAYQLVIVLMRALFLHGEDSSPLLKGQDARASTLVELANACSRNGQPREAVRLFEQAIAMAENMGDDAKKNVAIGLGNLANNQLPIGALRASEVNLRRRIALCGEMKDEINEATGHRDLGRLLGYRGKYVESKAELMSSLQTLENREQVQSLCFLWAYRVMNQLHRLRSAKRSTKHNPMSLVVRARRALELADETARTTSPVERDFIVAKWLLGATLRVAKEFDEAERNLQEALERCRRIGLVDLEADILIDLARLRAATGTPDESQRLAEETLVITDRCGYVLQGADAHLELAKLALSRNAKSVARHHATEARRLATCDGPPDYTYKAAYDEESALLKKLS
jgi:tetratricopeptide (TPR) repeat protein